MAWRAKDATIILVDIGCRMQENCHSNAELTKSDMAVGLARAFVQQKLFFQPKHEVAVVFFGAQDTKNALQADGYQHVVVEGEGTIDAPTIDLIKLLIAPRGGHESDVIDGLIVATDLMIRRTANYNFNKTIWLITDCLSIGVGDDPDLMESFKQLSNTATKLKVTVVDSHDAPQWGAWSTLSASIPSIELEPFSAAAVASSICVKPVEQRAKVRIPLVVSPDFEIPVGVYSKTCRASFPTLKKCSKLAGQIGHRKTDNVILERTYHVADDPDGEEIKKEDRIKGHKYGQAIVPMSEYDEAALMYSCERTLTTLGFAQASSISPEHNIHVVECVAADKGDYWAYTAFESLVEAMLADDRVLIARYCFRKNAQPKMVALFPQKLDVHEAATMTMQYLPFAEDIREWPFGSLPPPTSDQREAVSALLDSFDLDTAACEVSAKGTTQAEFFQPERTFNPCLRRFYSFVSQRAIDGASAKLPSAPNDIIKSLGPPELVLKRASAAKVAENLKVKFGLARVEKKSSKKRKFWREAIADKAKEVGLAEVDTKNIKVAKVKKDEKDEKLEKDEEKVKREGIHVPDLFDARGPPMAQPVLPAPAPPVVQIGSVHPERDFERWLAHRSGGVDTVGPAIKQMIALIEKFAEEGGEYLSKAISCLTVLRRGCVREGESLVFNDFLRRLRETRSDRETRLWERARDVQLGLITDTEVATSTVTADEARAFLAGEEANSSSRPPGSGKGTVEVAAPLSEKDLLDMID